MSQPLLGTIALFAGNFAPKGWALCAGQLLPIAQNAALFSILGTTYGGNGSSTFALPNLCGRAPVGAGQSTTGTSYTLGQSFGAESVTLNANQLPAHMHVVAPPVSSSIGTQVTPSGGYPAQVNPGGSRGSSASSYNAYASVSNAQAAAYNTASTGNNLAVSILSPSLVVNYIIALQGIFPSRN
ncbi:MAG: tail fiber protein [Acidobacteriaceae bacterium]|nr:tail fiber protein [Acidobacteriaceae bacterium]